MTIYPCDGNLFAALHGANIFKCFHLPRPRISREAGFAGEELLHGGLLEIALLGDQLLQSRQRRIDIR